MSPPSPPRPFSGRRLAVVLLLVGIAGCQQLQPVAQVRRQLPTYNQIVERYNRRVERITQIRASLTVAYTQRDAEGDHHLQGDGQLAIRLPDQLMCRISHIGRGTIMWAGSNSQLYWWFDALPDQDKRLYYGRHIRFADHDPQQMFPLHPKQLPHLLGIVPLAAATSRTIPKVGWDGKHYVVQPVGTRMLLRIDPNSFEPTRVDVYDRRSRRRIMATLSEPTKLELTDAPPGGWPRVATRIVILRLDTEEELSLKMSLPRDSGFNEKWFDLQMLMKKVFKIQADHRVDLDRQSVAGQNFDF